MSASAASPSAAAAQEEKVIEDVSFATEEEAIAGRQRGLEHFNKGELEEALAVQAGVLEFFTTKYGESSSKLGLYYLDYGLSLLELIQGNNRPADAAALKGVDEDDAECCFNTLELARVCLEKQEVEEGESEDLTYRIAEVHGAIAQLELEKDSYENAMQEFEHTLLLLRSISPKTPESVIRHSKALTTALFNCALCFMHEEDFAGAATELKSCLDFIETLPSGTISPDLIEEINAFYLDAVDNRDNKTLAKAKESIHELFPDEKQEVMVEEVLGKIKPEGGGNPFLSEMPGGSSERGHTSSLLMTNLIPIPGRECSNSTSRSTFPVQGTGERSRSSFSVSNGPVNIAVARKKEKKPADTAQTVDGEPATKKSRPEDSA